MVVVTSGAQYIDIDAYACAVAYAELLSLTGASAIAASSAPLNESIPEFLRALNAPLVTNYSASKDDQYVLVDTSNAEHFDTFVDTSKITQIFDHHPGFEQFWHERLAEDSHIEFIGAAATLIFEQWKIAGKLAHMSNTSAQLLAAAILDNTFNFGAQITTERDRVAYRFLAKQASLDDQWTEKYFLACQSAILTDITTTLRNDTKYLDFPGLPKKACVGQIVVWDATSIIQNDYTIIADSLRGSDHFWMANIVSISEDSSYFLSDDTIARAWLSKITGVSFKGSIAQSERMWLRKEIMKAAQ